MGRNQRDDRAGCEREGLWWWNGLEPLIQMDNNLFSFSPIRNLRAYNLAQPIDSGGLVPCSKVLGDASLAVILYLSHAKAYAYLQLSLIHISEPTRPY